MTKPPLRARTDLPEAPDAPSTFIALGYVERARSGGFVILER
jgi:hypothetical protein